MAGRKCNVYGSDPRFLLRSADKLPLAQCNAASRGLVMATCAPATESAHSDDLGTVLPDR
jgi:hypothetical protein